MQNTLPWMLSFRTSSVTRLSIYTLSFNVSHNWELHGLGLAKEKAKISLLFTLSPKTLYQHRTELFAVWAFAFVAERGVKYFRNEAGDMH
jgi:hypothetical protein